MIEQEPSIRVVVLSPDAACASQESAALAEQGVQVVRVTTAYEAAAELIAEPAAALVVDLRLLGPRHLRLLTIAREGQVEILAVGGLPPGMNSEDLSGVRLVSRADLATVLNKIAVPVAAPVAAPIDELLERDLDEPFEEPLDEPAEDFEGGAQLVPAKVADEEEMVEESQDYQPQASAVAPQAPAPAAEPAPQTATPAPASPNAPQYDEQKTLLTAQELAALLENEA